MDFKHCKKCNQDKPLFDFYSDKSRKSGVSAYCKSCMIKGSTERAKKNSERRKEVCAKYREKNREKIKESSRICQSKRKDKLKAWAKANSEKVKEYKRNWAKRNAEQNRAIKAVNKAKRRGATGKYTSKQIRSLLESQMNGCVVCKTDISKKYHVDHIVPISKNGTNHIENIQLLCPTCNLKKSNKNFVDFMQENGYLL